MDGDLHDLVGAYAVDALSDDEQVAFARHLQGCALCRHELIQLRETASALGLSAQEDPPDELRGRVLAAAAVTPQEQPRRVARLERPRVSKLLAGVAAVLSVAVLGLTVVAVRASNRVDELAAQLAASNARTASAEAQVVAVLTAPDARSVELAGGQLMARMVYSPQLGEGVVVDDNMPPAPSGKTYQFWLIGPDGATSAGTFEPGPRGRVNFTPRGEFDRKEAVGVSLEPEGGSPQPTDVLLTGSLV